MRVLRPAVWLLGSLSCTVLLGAQAPAPPLTPQQLATVVAASLRLTHLIQDVTVTADGKSVSTVQTQIKVLSAAAARTAQFPVPFNATLEDLEIPEAYTLKADGTRIPVDPSTIVSQRPAATDALAPVYSDREQKVIIFPNVEPGDSMVFTSKTTQKAAVIPGQFTMARTINDALPVDEIRYSVTAPAAMALNFDASWPHDTVRQGDTVTYRWTRMGAGPAPQAPPPVADLAKTQHLLVSSFRDFDALAHDYATLVGGKIAVTPAIQKQADALAGNLTDKRDQARAIYDWVGRNVRYVGIELGAGNIVPHDPDWTLTNRYGDCKDHAVLFASLLKARGIDAQLVLINANNRYKLGGVATISDFNHMIVFLPGLDLYADTTMAWIPFGQLPNADAGKPVLHVAESGAARHQTPVVAPGTLDSSYVVHAVMNEQGGMLVDMTTRATGSWAASLRRIDEELRTLGPELSAKRLLTQRNFPNATGTLLPGSGDDTSYQITGNARLGRPTPQTNLLNVANALDLLGRAGDNLMGPLNNRTITDADDTVCYSGHQREEMAITFRPGTRPPTLPAELHLKTANLAYDTHWSVEGDTVTVSRDFTAKMSEPLCTAATRHEAAEALAKIRADYSLAFRQVADAPPPLYTPPPAQ
jgi:hypothetical protein